MTISDFGSLGEIIGAIATVGTLIYIAIQIRENTSWSKRQVLEAVIDRLNTWQARMNENPELLKIYLDGKEGYESFEEADKYRYNFIMIELLGMFEVMFEHGKTKAVKPEASKSASNWIQRELDGSGAQAWWREMGRKRCSSDYAEYVDEMLSQTGT